MHHDDCPAFPPLADPEVTLTWPPTDADPHTVVWLPCGAECWILDGVCWWLPPDRARRH